MMKKIVALAALAAGTVNADIYMQNPRGSNNRCDENSNDTNNNNRLFNSQNNNAGGYQVNANSDGDPFRVQYYENTDLELRWTNQHTCGPNNHCEMIMQYACAMHFDADNLGDEFEGDGASGDVRDGEPQADNNTGNTCTGDNNRNRGEAADGADRGRHESKRYWFDCEYRERNDGLYRADKNINGQNARRTRQNNGATQYGFECQEERDYYPYWHPTPFVDIAVLTSTPDRCDYYQEESQNVKAKGFCDIKDNGRGEGEDPNPNTNNRGPNNPVACEAFEGETSWKEHPSWRDYYIEKELTRGNVPGAPACQQAPSSLLNRLGAGLQSSNADARPSANDGNHMSFTWRIPYVPIPDSQDDDDEEGKPGSGKKVLKTCIVRMRYNITNAEVPFDTDYRNNTQDGIVSPIYQDPYLMVNGVVVRHAINTNQAGRTFQDRSHSFDILKRNSEVGSGTIHNLNRCGKRGNIAQVRNCIEYEFCPSVLSISENDVLHVQFGGSDFGAAGNAGQGRDKTERSSIVQVNAHKDAIRIEESTVFTDEDAKFLARPNHPLVDDAEGCSKENFGYPYEDANQEDQNANNNCAVLNLNTGDANTPQVNRIIKDFKDTGTFYFKDMRNNNFSNRGQGLELKVRKAGLTDAQIAGIVVGSVVGVAAIAACVAFVVMKNNNPDFQLKDMFSSKV